MVVWKKGRGGLKKQEGGRGASILEYNRYVEGTHLQYKRSEKYTRAALAEINRDMSIYTIRYLIDIREPLSIYSPKVLLLLHSRIRVYIQSFMKT